MSAPGGPPVTYFERWHGVKHQPIGPISASEARRRNTSGEPYMAALGNLEHPDALIEVSWATGHLGVSFLDERNRRYLAYDFTRLDANTLFLTGVTVWKYPAEAVRDFNSAHTVESFVYRKDGQARQTITDVKNGQEEIVDRSNVPLDTNWDRAPQFGDWAAIARYDRELKR